MKDYRETKRKKARQLRYRKPIAKNINLDYILENLYGIMSECESVRWWIDFDDETLINALDGDEDEAYELKLMFTELYAECERMYADLKNKYVPECFDRFFAAIGAGEAGGGLLRWDSYAQVYLGLQCADSYARQRSREYLKRMRKDDLIEAALHCFKIYHAYMGLEHRYDCLKAAMDILRDKNTGYLQMVRQIEEAYERANEVKFYEMYGSTKDFERLINNMPQEAWIQ